MQGTHCYIFVTRMVEYTMLRYTYIACRVYKMGLLFCSVHFVRVILYRPDELDVTIFPPTEPDSGHSYIASFCCLTLGSR